jgi:hypothetical protein
MAAPAAAGCYVRNTRAQDDLVNGQVNVEFPQDVYMH